MSINNSNLILGLISGMLLTLITGSIYNTIYTSKEKDEDKIKKGLEGMIGDTPLIEIQSLSKATGCRILAKAEYLNPGGSPKDRLALGLILSAEQAGHIIPHSDYTIYEGTVGSTGISLALLCNSRGYKCHIVMPNDMAIEKVLALQTLGATVERVEPASIVDPNHFVNIARKRAKNDERGYFIDQFENLENWKIHFKNTGKEILNQCNFKIDGFVSGAGTGGTLTGISQAIKTYPSTKDCIILLADPQGSGLFNKVMHDTLYSSVQKEGQRTRNQVDTLVEGIGLTRLTNNFKKGLNYIDSATQVKDQVVVDMSRWLMKNDGLFVGSSSAVNCVGAYRLAHQLGPGHTIVTLLCDSGTRHQSKFWNDEFIINNSLKINYHNDLNFCLD